MIAILRLNSEQSFRQNLFENFTKNYRNSVEFCTIFSLFNIYIFTLSFVYSPAKNAMKGKKILLFFIGIFNFFLKSNISNFRKPA
jgi:hypothetical protein